MCHRALARVSCEARAEAWVNSAWSEHMKHMAQVWKSPYTHSGTRICRLHLSLENQRGSKTELHRSREKILKQVWQILAKWFFMFFCFSSSLHLCFGLVFFGCFFLPSVIFRSLCSWSLPLDWRETWMDNEWLEKKPRIFEWLFHDVPWVSLWSSNCWTKPAKSKVQKRKN